MSIAVKICGLTTPGGVRAACDAGAAYTGFVFYPKSPRHITGLQAAALAALVPETIRKVGVFVDPNDDDLRQILGHVALDLIQLHGSESPARLQQIKDNFKLPVIKAIAVADNDDIAYAKTCESVADILLFDAKPPISHKNTLPGGNGLSFDWQLIKTTDWHRPWLLSGGLNEGNVMAAVAASGAKAVDVSSGVESRPGVKDSAKINGFMRILT